MKKVLKKGLVRTEPLPQDEAKKKILELCPEEAGIFSISFDENKSEVFIEAKKPGLVIGRGGLVLKQITENIG
ncbi:MAG: KH domain-containing protein [Promethearchaeota archaeon]